MNYETGIMHLTYHDPDIDSAGRDRLAQTGNPVGFPFNLGDEIGDDSVRFRKNFNGGLASEAEGGVERYAKARMYLDVSVRPQASAEKGQLSAGAPPLGDDTEGTAEGAVTYPKPVIANGGGGQDFMGVFVSDLVHGPQGPIPSFIWSAGYDDLDNVWMKIIAEPVYNLVLEGRGRVPERVLIPFGLLAVDGECAGEKDVVKPVPEVAEHIPGAEGKLGRHCGLELDLDYVLAGLRIDLLKAGPIVSVNERGRERVESADVFLRFFDKNVGAIERAIHD